MKNTVTLENEAGGMYKITHPDHKEPIFVTTLGHENGPYLVKAFNTNSGKLISKKLGKAASRESFLGVFYESAVTYAKTLAENNNYNFQNDTHEVRRVA